MPIDFYVGPTEAPDTYRLIRQLGAGGEGEVWEAVEQLSERGRLRVAVKIMAPTGDPEAISQWDDTARLLRALSHPGLVHVLDAFLGPDPHRVGELATGASAYVVMDYVEGMTLSDWTIEHPKALAGERLRILLSVASALDDMHSGRRTDVPVAHGDIKPSNIVVRPEGGTMLVDLGLVRLIDAAGRAGRSMPYAAPELREAGSRATPEADRYAFAVTVAQVLTGQPPPLAPDGWLDPAALQERLRTHAFTSRRHMLVRHLMEAITAPPEARPQNLRHWLSASLESLSQVTEAGAVEPSRIETVAHASDRVERRRVRFAAFVGVLGVAVIALLLTVSRATDREIPGTSTSDTAGPAPSTSVPGMHDQYGCATLTTLPATVPLPLADSASPPDVTYEVDSSGPTAKPFQLHVGGYIDQAFVALHPSVTAVAAVPGLDFSVGPDVAQLQYELWDLDGHKLGPTLTVRVDSSNANGPVAGEFVPPVAVHPGQVYYLRVISVDAIPAVGIYLRSPTGQRLSTPFPVCLVDADPTTGRRRAVLERQGNVLSGRIGNDA